MFKNRIGMKFIGATLTAAMAVTAIPAMASLAAERDFSYLYSSYKHDHADGPLEMVTREQLSSRLTSAMNFYYENESKIPEGVQNRCWEVFNYVSYVINNPESRPDNYAIANHDLMSTNRTIAFFGDSELPLADEPLIAPADAQAEEEDEPVAPDYGMDLDDQTDDQADDTEDNEVLDPKSEALQRLQAIINEMVEFEEVFGDEMAAVTDMYEYHTLIALGGSVYLTSNEYTVNGINCISDRLSAKLDAVIDAIDAAAQQPEETPAEEIAPDYGMNLDEDTDDDLVIEHPDDLTRSPDFQIDPQDSFTIDGEQPEDVAPDFGIDLEEDIPEENLAAEAQAPADETPADETPSDETPADETPVIDETPATPAVQTSYASAAPAAAPASAPAVTAAPVIVVPDRNAIAQQLVDRLYMDALNRTPDMVGSAYWVSVILEGEGNVDKVVAGFLNSAEFAARNLNDDEFVTTLYKVILNRVPSASEQAVWTNALASGVSRRAVINAFTASAEFDTTCEANGL